MAFGSILATVITNEELSLFEGAVAIALLISLQYVLTWFSVRSAVFSEAVKTTPSFVLRDGVFQHDAMKRVCVTNEEICTAAR